MKRSSGQREHPDGWHENNSHLSVRHIHTQTGLQTHTNTLAGVSPSCSESQEKQTDWGLLPTHVLLIEHTVTHVHLSDTRVCAHICSIISVCVLVS